MQDDAKRRVLLGEIGPAHGIHGEVVVRSYTGLPEDIAAYGPLEDEAGARTIELSVVRVTGKGVVVRILGVADRTAAERLRGTRLYIARDRLPEAADGEYYHSDLLGLKAVSPSGVIIGHVLAVQNFGAGDLLEIRLADSKATEFVPLDEAFVPEIDLDRGLLTVVMPELIDGEIAPGAGEDEAP